MIRLKALRQLRGDYGSIPYGGIFSVDDEAVAVLLESQGLVERIPVPPTLTARMMAPFANKMMKSEEVKVKTRSLRRKRK